MKQYSVQITDKALEDMEEIYIREVTKGITIEEKLRYYNKQRTDA
jgi:hypothetical protein